MTTAFINIKINNKKTWKEKREKYIKKRKESKKTKKKTTKTEKDNEKNLKRPKIIKGYWWACLIIKRIGKYKEIDDGNKIRDGC